MADETREQMATRLEQLAARSPYLNGDRPALSAGATALRASPSREERVWQPIATAPRDGTPVRLKWDATTVEAIGRWAGGNLLYAATGWRDVKGNDLLLEPTHWKPSPPEIPR